MIDKTELAEVFDKVTEDCATNSYLASVKCQFTDKLFYIKLVFDLYPRNVKCILLDIQNGIVIYKEVFEDGSINKLITMIPIRNIQIIQEVKENDSWWIYYVICNVAECFCYVFGNTMAY